jgi:hypothetical protein
MRHQQICPIRFMHIHTNTRTQAHTNGTNIDLGREFNGKSALWHNIIPVIDVYK